MILATRFTFIVEKSWKNMYFHTKFARLPSTYDVIARDSNWSSLNLSLSQNVRDGLTNSTQRSRPSSCPSTPHPPPLHHLLPLHVNPWITKIVRLEILKWEAVSLFMLWSSMSVVEFLLFLVKRLNLVPIWDGLCGSFTSLFGWGLKQPYFW